MKKKKLSKKKAKMAIAIHPMVRSSFRDAILQALRANNLEVKMIDGASITVHVINGIAYTDEAAVEKIMGQYSWWNEE